MKRFAYVNATSLKGVPSLLGNSWEEAQIMAGGTDIVGELKEGIISPNKLVNLKTIPGMRYIKATAEGLRIGALTPIGEIESHSTIQQHYPGLAQAAASVATPQIRNVGTIGGNLCQRPRCWYYRNADFPCLRKGGYRCYAAEGRNKYHAIFGAGPCYIVHPSDTAPALISLEARLTILGPNGTRQVPLAAFFELPLDNLYRENILQPNEIITEVQVPPVRPNTRSLYLKMGEKQSLDFAMASVALAATLEGGVCHDLRLVCGGVAPVPWRSRPAEEVVRGRRIDESLARKAAQAAVDGANPLSENKYKVLLIQGLIKRALLSVA